MATTTTRSKPAARASKPGGYLWNKTEAPIARSLGALVRTFRSECIAANKLDPKMQINATWTGLQMPVVAAAPVRSHSAKTTPRKGLTAGAGGGGSASASSR